MVLRVIDRVRVIAALAALSLGAFFLATVPAAGPAAASTAPAIGGHTACNFENPDEYCSEAAVTYVGPASQCGNPDYFGVNDRSGVPIYWTYANGSTRCTQVTYRPDFDIPQNVQCSWYLYIPNGDATATMKLSIESSTGSWDTWAINENPVSGWQYIGSTYNYLGYATFTDANGQGYPLKLGWGSTGYGIWITC